MKTLLRIAALLGLLLCVAPVNAAEVIHSFNSNVEVAKDGEFTVTETLRVRAEGSAMRHGIYRDFPLTFRDAGGTLREVMFSLLSVSRDGQPEPYHTERLHNFIRIYAGDKDVLIRPGEHIYVFRYSTGRQVRWFDGKPELNWNVTGNYWNFPISAARYRLHLVGNARPVRWTAFTGRIGDRGMAWNGEIGADGVLTVATVRSLTPGEGLTVVAELPGGAVDPPSQNTLLWYQLFDNRQWILGTARLRAGAHLLRCCLVCGRPRSEGRHRHPAVPPAAGRFAGACQLHPRLGLGARKMARLHGGRVVAGRARAHPLRSEGQHADADADRPRAGRAASPACPPARARFTAGSTSAAAPSSTRRTANRSPRSATTSPKASSRKTATVSSAAISAMSSPGSR